jgi:hypothetical protein
MKAAFLSRLLVGLGIVGLLVCGLSVIGPVRVETTLMSGVRAYFSYSFTATPAGWVITGLLLVSGITIMAYSEKKRAQPSAQPTGLLAVADFKR